MGLLHKNLIEYLKWDLKVRLFDEAQNKEGKLNDDTQW